MPFSTIPIKGCSKAQRLVTPCDCSVAKKDHHNCTSKEFEECLDALSAITQTEDLALAATREELNLVCRKLQHGVRCIDDHSIRCFTAGQKRIFNSVVSESRHVINDLCIPESFKRVSVISFPRTEIQISNVYSNFYQFLSRLTDFKACLMLNRN
ncbi:uncharacterized protein CEXT_620161 [Caerostris extrusa]|uniref:Uncharacterized protein n=1 Tax=Caerostris extrusa TaxID=172846 RepID=A0AAV4NWV0_CAEEX|nr:uncharacterized protein CEXT_620161 [Caerostris extrusa]